MPKFVRAKRMGWNESKTADVTRVDILDPYDYTDDDIEGEYVVTQVANDRVGPYTQHLVGGQVADPETITPITVQRSKGDVVAFKLPKGTTQVTPGYLSEENYNAQNVLRMPGDSLPAPVINTSDASAHGAGES